MKRLCGMAALAALTLGLCLGAGSRADDQKQTDAQKHFANLNDQQFVQIASASGLAEVNLGKMAAQHASSAEVKRFGEHMVADHTKANQELMRLADAKQMRLAPAMDAMHEQLANRLTSMQGEQFDREYMNAMVKDHKLAVALFTAESKNGQDSDLKSFASKTLPALKDHLKHAQQLAGGDHQGAEKVHSDQGKTDRRPAGGKDVQKDHQKDQSK